MVHKYQMALAADVMAAAAAAAGHPIRMVHLAMVVVEANLAKTTYLQHRADSVMDKMVVDKTVTVDRMVVDVMEVIMAMIILRVVQVAVEVVEAQMMAKIM